jgi:hypothetical protein
MGHIFRPKYKDKKTGNVKESAVWWIKYHKNGKPYFESAKTTEETKAKRLLRKRGRGDRGRENSGDPF